DARDGHARAGGRASRGARGARRRQETGGEGAQHRPQGPGETAGSGGEAPPRPAKETGPPKPGPVIDERRRTSSANTQTFRCYAPWPAQGSIPRPETREVDSLAASSEARARGGARCSRLV